MNLDDLLVDVARARLEPGDVVVVRVSRHLSAAAAGAITSDLKDAFPDHQVVVLPPDINLEVIAPS